MLYIGSNNTETIKNLCERAAQECLAKINSKEMIYPDKSTIRAYSYKNMFSECVSNKSNIQVINQEKELSENSLIVDKTPKIEGLVKYWSDFEVGKQYYLWARRITNSNKKIYTLKYLIRELNGDTLNICIMKQQEGPKTKIFTLTESDCEHIGIEFEDGLEVYPANLFWIKL